MLNNVKLSCLTSTSHKALLEVAEAAADLAVNLKNKTLRFNYLIDAYFILEG